MKRIAFFAVAAFVLIDVPTGAPMPTNAAALQPQSTFCYSASIDPNLRQWFYTDIFQSDPAEGRKVAQSFDTYLHNNYSDRSPGPSGCRYFANDYAAGRDKKTLQAASNADSTETGWKY